MPVLTGEGPALAPTVDSGVVRFTVDRRSHVFMRKLVSVIKPRRGHLHA